MQIGMKIYYDKATGNVILNTGSRSGDVVETTREQDFAAYSALAERVPDTVGILQLEYGQYAEDFAECSGYRINQDTGELEFSYPEPGSESEKPVVYQKPLTEQMADLLLELAQVQQRQNQIEADNAALLLISVQGGAV